MRTQERPARNGCRHPEGRRHRPARPDEGRAAQSAPRRQSARHSRAWAHRRRAGRSPAHRIDGHARATRRASPDSCPLPRRWPRPRDSRPARRSGTWRRSAATCCSGRAAGISARCITTACARAARRASRSPARTSITRSSATTAAPSCIRRPPRRLWSHSMPRLSWSVPGTAKRVVALEDFFLTPERGHRARERSEAGRNPDCRGAAAIEARRSFRAPAAGRAGFLRLADCRRGGRSSTSDTDGVCRQASVVLGAAAPVPYRAKGAEIRPGREARFPKTPRAARRARRSPAPCRSARTPTSCRSSRRW